jgi:CHAD domain-containing protein
MKRIYRRGRKRIRAAAAEPTTENLHEARKRAKDLWHATQVMRLAAPKRMEHLAADAHAVADLLGDDHDLAVLREYVERHPQHFDDDDRRQALLAVIDRRRGSLQRRALKQGRRLYKRVPKRFMADLERGWRKRAADQPDIVAG